MPTVDVVGRPMKPSPPKPLRGSSWAADPALDSERLPSDTTSLTPAANADELGADANRRADAAHARPRKKTRVCKWSIDD